MQTGVTHFTSTKPQSVPITNVLCQVVLVGKQFVKINGAGADAPKKRTAGVLPKDVLGAVGLCEDEHTKFSPGCQSSDFFHCSCLKVFEEDGKYVGQKMLTH